jgi:hypothetical protein
MSKAKFTVCLMAVALACVFGARTKQFSPDLAKPDLAVEGPGRPSSVPAPSGRQSNELGVEETLNGYAANLAKTASCYESDCAYPRTDTKSYHFAVGTDLKNQLEIVRQWAVKNRVVHGELVAIANEYLQIEDGNVQSAALALLATQPPNADSLEAILSQVIRGYDSELIAAAMQELKRYANDENLFKIGAALSESMLTGAPFVAKEVSKLVQPFIAPTNWGLFVEAAQKLPAESLIRTNLETALHNYTRNP